MRSMDTATDTDSHRHSFPRGEDQMRSKEWENISDAVLDGIFPRGVVASPSY